MIILKKTNYGRGHVINNVTDALAPTIAIAQIEYNMIICMLKFYKVHIKLNVEWQTYCISIGLVVAVSASSQ